MESYPLNVLLALLAAFITVLLGFVPVKNLPARFFQKHIGVAAVLWMAVLIMMPRGWYIILGAAILCIIAWVLWGKKNTLQAKVWQSASAAVGVTLGVITVLQLTPQAMPADAPQAAQSWFLAGPFLVGAVVGSSYVLAAMAWQYSAIETNEVSAKEELGLLRTLLAWNLIALGLQAVFALCALLLLPMYYPDFGAPFAEHLTSFEPPEGLAWLFIARMALGFVLPFVLVAWLYTHSRKAPITRWFWWPLLSACLVFVGQLLALQLHL